MNKQYHSLTEKELFVLTDSSQNGLNSSEAKHRLHQDGPNVLAKTKKYSRLAVFFDQFKSPLVYILVGASGASWIAGERIDARVILVAVMINICIGFIQEDKANNALNKLRKLVEYKARIRRQGKNIEILAEELVIGDILVLSAGQVVLADARLLQSSNLESNEASLTGESQSIQKNTDILNSKTNLADRTNMVYAGTNILCGNGIALVVAIGQQTEIGKISQLVKNTDSGSTPLQEKLNNISKKIGLAVLAISIIIVATGLINGLKFIDVFVSAIAVAVAAVPEGLPMTVTVILALGMKQIVKKRALTRKLLAAETLGSITVICSDKTGTLTEGRMKLKNISTLSSSLIINEKKQILNSSDKKNFENIIKNGVLCNNSIYDVNGKIFGSALEIAFLNFVNDLSIDCNNLRQQAPRIYELPFNSKNKFMISLHRLENGYRLYEKGAGEILIKKCLFIEDQGKVRKITSTDLIKINQNYNSLTLSGLRVIAFAYRDLITLPLTDNEKNVQWSLIDKELIFSGLMAFQDPLRSDAQRTITLCQHAGIRPIIITGDHPNTALAIASELKLEIGRAGVITGDMLDILNNQELKELVKKSSVYARVSPEHKLRIVQALKNNGEVVAMTGDGLNDSPALKAADIGICLGSGTEVAKETADIVLLDDNFSVIVEAIRQGRIIFDNIRKTVTYLVSASFSEIILILGSILFHTPLALLPIQILWINIVSDSFPSFALAFERGDAGVMNQQPIKRQEKLFNQKMKAIIFGVGIIRDSFLFVIFYYLTQNLNLLGWNIDYLRTIFFAILITKHLSSIFSLRNLSLPIYKIEHRHNTYLFITVGLSFLSLCLAIYTPFLNNLLSTKPLNTTAWLFIFLAAVIDIGMIETVKFIYNKKSVS